MNAGLLRVLCLSMALSASLGHKHVVFMHGILAGPEEWTKFEQLIQKDQPGTPMTNINMFNKVESLTAMWKQVDEISKKIAPILTNKTSEGTILICFSQGGLICRGLLSILEHNVDTFIVLSSPLAGQFGDTDYLKFLFPYYVRDNIYRVLYNDIGQKLSIGNYWYDPHHTDLYAKFSAYLGLINGQTSLYNPHIQTYRSNFLRLKTMVLVGGPDDGVITPWQSSHFGMYNDNMDLIPMEEQPWYINDTFGLQTLNKRGAIQIHTIEGIKHIHWHTETQIYECCIKPWLS